MEFCWIIPIYPNANCNLKFQITQEGLANIQIADKYYIMWISDSPDLCTWIMEQDL